MCAYTSMCRCVYMYMCVCVHVCVYEEYLYLLQGFIWGGGGGGGGRDRHLPPLGNFCPPLGIFLNEPLYCLNPRLSIYIHIMCS